MLRIAVFVSGGGTNLQAIIDQIALGKLTNVELALVVSNKEGAFALQRAKEHHIPFEVIMPRYYDTNEAYEEALLKKLREHRIDLIVLAGYLAIFSKRIISSYENQIINIHPSLLPAFGGKGYYGLHVHRAVLERGVKLTGATVHFVDTGTDTGPIILQKAVAVLPDDTPEQLQKRVMEEAEWKILPHAIHLIANDQVSVRGKRVYIGKEKNEE